MATTTGAARQERENRLRCWSDLPSSRAGSCVGEKDACASLGMENQGGREGTGCGWGEERNALVASQVVLPTRPRKRAHHASVVGHTSLEMCKSHHRHDDDKALLCHTRVTHPWLIEVRANQNDGGWSVFSVSHGTHSHSRHPMDHVSLVDHSSAAQRARRGGGERGKPQYPCR